MTNDTFRSARVLFEGFGDYRDLATKMTGADFGLLLLKLATKLGRGRAGGLPEACGKGGWRLVPNGQRDVDDPERRLCKKLPSPVDPLPRQPLVGCAEVSLPGSRYFHVVSARAPCASDAS